MHRAPIYPDSYRSLFRLSKKSIVLEYRESFVAVRREGWLVLTALQQKLLYVRNFTIESPLGACTKVNTA